MDNINESIIKYGVDVIDDSDLLVTLTGIKKNSATLLIQEHGLIDAVKYLDAYKLTDAQTKRMIMLYEYARRIAMSQRKDKKCMDSSSKSGQFFIDYFMNHRVEELNIALLDAQNNLIAIVPISRGTLNETPVYSREIVRIVLAYNALNAVLAHNHPGGSLTVSSTDINATKEVGKALDAVKVKLVDHIIVAGDSYTSMAEKGLLP